MFIANCW